MKWLREAISDDGGLADMAYISIGALTVAAIASLCFIFMMSVVAYFNCAPVADVTTTDVTKAATTVAVKRCNFDPLPVGQAAGLIFGAFAALIGSLAGYMAATRRSGRTTTTTTTTTVPAGPHPAADPTPDAIAILQPPDKLAKAKPRPKPKKRRR